MERLKVAIADKILEASSGDELQMKQKLSKIQRFGDFAEACKSLMAKYPQIEAELLEMVHDNDFDTARASRVIDSIINRLQGDEPSPVVPAEQEVTATPSDEPVSDEVRQSLDSTPQETLSPDAENREIEAESGDADKPDEEIVFTTFGEESALDEENIKKERQKKIFGIVWRVLAVAVVIAVIIMVVRFVISYWKYVLLVLVVLGAVIVLWQYLKKKKQRNS